MHRPATRARQFALVVPLSTLVLSAVHPAAAGPIAIVADGPSDQLTERIARLRAELTELTRDDPNPLELPAQPTHLAQFDLSSARAALRRALEDPSVKVIVGTGFFVGVAAGELQPSPAKPIILPFAAPDLQGLPQKGGTSGRRNLTFLTGLFDLEKDLSRFREIIRDKTVGFFVDSIILDKAAEIIPASARADAQRLGSRLIPLGTDAATTLSALPEEVEAIYLPLHFRMSFAEMTKLIEGLNERKIPTYAGMGPDWVARGAFVTLVPSDLETERFRRVALYIRDALAGDALSQMQVSFPRRTALLFNMGTARRIGVYPSFELMTEAQLIQPKKRKAMELELLTVVEAALRDNPAYRATDEELRATEAALRERRGALLPQLSANMGLTWLDPDVATNVTNPERNVEWGTELSQLLFDANTLFTYLSQKRQVLSVAEDRRTARLDLVLEVIQSFLNVLQARAVETLNRDNLRLIRRNRALAELRVEIGTSGRQDVARWNISLADGRANTIQASATRNQAEIDLNRILAVELERSFVPKLPPDGPRSMVIPPRLEAYVRDLLSFRILRAFMAQEALANSPEIASLDALIEAQAKLLTGTEWQLYIPSLVLSAGFTSNIVRDGRGSGPINMPPFPERDDFTWQWGASLNFRVFDDIRYGRLQRIRRTRSQLVAQRENLANQIEQRVRSALHQAGASGAAVGLRQDAVEAARINLEAVASAYREGAATIITLIDAQNESLRSEINAANALYTFLSDFSAALRASGRFIFLMPPEEQKEMLDRLDAFAAEARQSEEIQ